MVAIISGLIASAPAYSSDVPVEMQLMGFNDPLHELQINPCVDDSLLSRRFGPAGLSLANDVRATWPKNLCKDIPTLRSLVRWNYLSTLLLANTERPSVANDGIQSRTSRLKKCKTIKCLNSLLPFFNQWVQLSINRTPVVEGDASINQLPLMGESVILPELALRGLVLPLNNQSEACGSEHIDALNFSVANATMAGEPAVVVRCAKTKQTEHTWILKQSINTKKKIKEWQEILDYEGDLVFFILPGARAEYPTLYSQRKDGVQRVVSIFDFVQVQHRYVKTVEFVMGVDLLGRVHAFPL